MGYTTTDLVSMVKVLASVPTNQATFTDQEILDLAHIELQTSLYSYIIKQREEWFVRNDSYALVSGQSAYPIPDRAFSGVLREVKIVKNGSYTRLIRLDVQDIPNTNQTGTPTGFYMQGSDIVLYPTPNNSEYSLVLYYFTRPSRLVPVTECGRVMLLASATVTGSFPSTWTTADTYDIVENSRDNKATAMDLAASSVTTTNITFATAPSAVVGSYVCLSGNTCLPQIPKEVFPILVQLTVTRVHESLKALDAMAASMQKTKQLMDSMIPVVSLRVQGSPKRVVSSTLRGR